MDEKTRLFQADFDRIAPFEGDGWGHNQHYTHYLLKHLPAHCSAVCEIGCGTGALARMLAARADAVLALDLSPVMIHIAQQRSKGIANIQYVMADVMAYDFPAEHFDAITSVATLHHMDAASIFTKLKRALAPGGVLAVLDLYKSASVTDYLRDVIAVPLEIALRLKHWNRPRQSQAAREAWDIHGKHDSYLTLAQIRHISGAVLPHAVVRRHLLWRYSLIWKKPAS
jgi:ubiquinone/menaquinone biosynthesis C-methylase UbiE